MTEQRAVPLTTHQAGWVLGVSEGRVRALLAAGILTGTRVGIGTRVTWLVDLASVQRRGPGPHKSGPRPKSARAFSATASPATAPTSSTPTRND